MTRTSLILAAALVLTAGALVAVVNRKPTVVTTPAASCTFNESEYLQLNPDVARAVARREFLSGRDHFERFGRVEGRAQAQHCEGTRSDELELGFGPCDFNETTYLALHPDVAAAVTRGAVGSGVAHYLRFGEKEGRRVSAACIPEVARPAPPERCAFHESEYLQLNPDVARAVAMGQFGSGKAHFDRFGLSEGRATAFGCPGVTTRERADLEYPACDFNETRYLERNPDVARAVSEGQERSGVAHYLRKGRAELRPPYTECGR